MRQRLKRALTKDVGLKILALFFSFLLWLVVVNIDDPTQTRTFTAVVTVTNDEVISNANKLYTIKDGINTVTFRVTAKRSIIEKLSSSDFTAEADMNYLESEERVPVTITANSYANNITISSKQNYLHVILEDKLTNKYVLDARIYGDPASGVAVESVECSPTVITVSGPEDIMDSIVKAEAACDVTGITENVTESVIPKFYDAKGNEVDSSKLSLSTASVSVSVVVANMKSVDIAVKTSGVLPANLELGSITTDPESVIIKGDALDLNSVTNITIPDTVINLSNVTGSYSTVVDISSYLPAGVTLADKAASKVTVYVTMAGDTAKTVAVPAGNITITNLGDGLTASIDADVIHTNVFGQQDVLTSIEGENITGHIDCSGLSIGEQQTVALQFVKIDNVTIQNVSVTVTIKAKESTESEEE